MLEAMRVHKWLFFGAALAGLAAGYHANSVVAGDLARTRAKTLACGILAAAQRAGRLDAAHGDELFAGIAKNLALAGADGSQSSRAAHCQPS